MIAWMKYDRENKMIDRGDASEEDIQRMMIRQEDDAISVMHETSADHVLYGVGISGSDGGLKTLQFYLWPLDDKAYQRITRRNDYVWAAHRRLGNAGYQTPWEGLQDLSSGA